MIRNEKIDVISILTESGNHFRHIKQVSSRVLGFNLV